MKIRVLDPTFIIREQKVPGEVICFFEGKECMFTVLQLCIANFEDQLAYQTIADSMFWYDLNAMTFYHWKRKSRGGREIWDFYRLRLRLMPPRAVECYELTKVDLDINFGLAREVMICLQNMRRVAMRLRADSPFAKGVFHG